MLLPKDPTHEEQITVCKRCMHAGAYHIYEHSKVAKGARG